MVDMASEERSGNEQIAKKLKPIPLQRDNADLLASKLASLSVTEKLSTAGHASAGKSNKNGSGSGSTEKISPVDFVTLQRLRSSALACRTSTTIKSSRDGGTLFDDLINSGATKKNEEKCKKDETKEPGSKSVPSKNASSASASKSAEKDEKESESAVEKTKPLLDDKPVVLLARGPVRNVRNATTTHAPYTMKNNGAALGQVPSGNTENYIVLYGACQYGFENANFSSTVETSPDFVNFTSSSSTPDTVQSDLGYSSSSPQHQISPNVEQSYPSPKDVLDSTQLPEDLSDFILKYSQEYTTTLSSPENGAAVRSRDSSISDSNNQINFDSPLYRILVEDDCVSPLSAKSVPQCSPVLPRTAAQIPVIFEENPLETTGSPNNSSSPGLQTNNQGRRERTTLRYAKNRLRTLIGDNEMGEAWAWTCKCIQELKGALCYQDPDGDSLLHIVILHMDLAKVYALVEQMLKAEDACTRRAFDMPNRAFETPLYLAVQKNSPEVVAYLVEAGANLNCPTAPPGQQTPLHLAASNGMIDIVEILCASRRVDVNIPNGMSQTPLLCAVKDNGVGARKTGLYIDNRSTIQCLLKYGANPMSTDSYGNSILHYAVNSLDADLIEMFKSCLDEETVTKLANKENLCGETPLESLQCEPEQDNERLRSNVFISLLRCGATVKSH